MRGLFAWDNRTSHRFGAAYLAVALVPLIASVPSGSALAWLAGHIAALAWLLHSVRPSRERAPHRIGRWSWVTDWAPLLLIPFAYSELPLLNQVFSTGYYDAWILSIERTVFGADPSAEWAGRFPALWFSEIVHLCYLSYPALIYVPPLAYYIRGDRRAFHTASAAVMLAFFACLIAFVFLPVQGPRYLRPAPDGIPLGPVRKSVLWILEGGSSQGAAFPSSHVSVVVAQVAVMARFYPRSAVPAAIVAVGLTLGAVYGGFHYATDAVAGGIVGLLAAASLPTMRRSSMAD